MAPRCTDLDVDNALATVAEPQGPGAPKPARHHPTSTAALTCAVSVDLSAYGSLVHRLHDRLEEEEAEADRERERVDGLFEELMAFAPDQREEALAVDARFANFFLCDRLLDHAEELVGSDRAASSELVTLALAGAGRLDAQRCGRSLIADLEARAWALLGEVWCESGSADAARTALRLARSHLRDGSGDPLEEAEVLYHEAAASRPESRDDAMAAVDRAAAIFLEHGTRRRLGESLVRKGLLTATTGDHRSAVPLLREALALLDDHVPERRLAEIGWRLTQSLLALGAADEAWTEIARSRSRLRTMPDELLEARLRFLEGQIAALANLDDEAAACLCEAREALLRFGRAEEAARAHLAWVALSCRTRATASESPTPAERESLGVETERLLATAGLSRETIMVLLLVDRAAASGRLRADLIAALDDFLGASS